MSRKLNYFGSYSGGYVFSDADAEAYYDAITLANGSDIDTSTLYSVTLDQFKEEINDNVIGLKTDGTWDAQNRLYPYLGGVVATQAIDMKTATSKLLFVGSPTHNADGVVISSSAQYVDSNEAYDTIATLNNESFGQWIKNSNGNMGMGYIGANRSTIYSQPTNSSDLRLDMNTTDASNGGRITSIPGQNLNKMITANKPSNILLELYNDGLVTGSNTNTVTGGGILNINIFFAIMNNNGSPLAPYSAQGDLMFNHLGNGMTAGQALNLKNRFETLFTNLNRI